MESAETLTAMRYHDGWMSPSRALAYAFGLLVGAASCKSARSVGETSAPASSRPSVGSARNKCSPHCEGFRAFTKICNVPYPLLELSGLAVSRTHTDILFAHNDSGDVARFFAFDSEGHEHGEFAVENAEADDWEDIGTGPCGDGSACIFIGDIGDNKYRRQRGSTATPGYVIYAIREPALDPKGGKTNAHAEKLGFIYPDGPHNSETLLVDSRTGDLFLVTKTRSGQSAVYQYPMPQRPNEMVTLVKVADFNVPTGGDVQITGGDIHPCEMRVVLRTYDRGFELSDPNARSVGDLFATTPHEVALPFDEQGEAFIYTADGHGLFTSSESPNGTSPPLRRAACND